jgi:hypothetical protein
MTNELPPGAEAALKEVEDAHEALRADAERLTRAIANLQAIVAIAKART